MAEQDGLPEFSVVMPVRNKGAYVARAIRSVLAQTHPDFELLVVCEPSRDDSEQQIRAINDHRLTLHTRNEAGAGGYAARNLGIRSARAHWIAFLDADDEWCPDHLANLAALKAAHPEARILSSGWMVQGVQQTADRYTQQYQSRGRHIIPLEAYLRYEVASIRPIFTGVACITRELLMACGLFPEGGIARSGDLDTWFRCVVEAGSLAWSPHVGAIYYRNIPGQVSRSEQVVMDLHTHTTVWALERADGPSLRQLISRRLNHLYFNAWVSNIHLPVPQQTPLWGVFDRSQPFLHQSKCWLYAMASLLPVPLAQRLHLAAAWCYRSMERLILRGR
jgi:glycosyltransferase involved in cell wall biosynthesis